MLITGVNCIKYLGTPKRYFTGVVLELEVRAELGQLKEESENVVVGKLARGNQEVNVDVHVVVLSYISPNTYSLPRLPI